MPGPRRRTTPARPAGAAQGEAPPCPACGERIPAAGERGACPACGLRVRFVDVPGRPCAACGAAVPLLPGKAALRCPACGAWSAREEGRPVVARAQCPRCRRSIDVPLQGAEADCPWCGCALALSDTFS